MGRVTIAMGTGRVSEEPYIYVLMTTVPGSTSEFAQGTEEGLYKTKDNMLNFTKVLLTQEGPGSTKKVPVFVPINLIGGQGTVGALVVDPSDPNVVYVGGGGNAGDRADPRRYGGHARQHLH